MINAAIVGLGWWGKNLVEAIQGKSERLRFVRGACRNTKPVEGFAKRHDLALSSSLGEVLDDPGVDAVVLATPHSLHAEQIVAAAGAGKPVLCEKPLTLTRADARRAIEACRRSGVLLALAENQRFLPNMREMGRIVASGELGEILHIEGHASNENAGRFFGAWRHAPSESPAGGMTGTGIHVLDAFIHLAGPVRSVYAQLVTRKPPPDPTDMLSAMFRFASGATGLLALVRSTPHYRRVHAFGRGGSAEALGETELVLRRSGQPEQRLRFQAIDSLRAELEAFADAITGKAPYPITGAEMLDTVAAFEALVASVGTDLPVLADGSDRA
ncbi:MAG: Gfo/Idh/MocA family oxidoreductase [Alphaproteobacteria bacterium]|nr:Gfo/Idh/MocA family oxidoreductase [Alphaproteobacteria bacterium]